MSQAEALAPVFAALGDATRLTLFGRLIGGEVLSISALSEGTGLTRQGVTKHLGVLEAAELVTRARVGRESLYQVRPDRMRAAQDYLARASAQWEDAADRLRRFVED